ncbi:hypothetical protein SK128_022010, partial [Halocaridina rubra]
GDLILSVPNAIEAVTKIVTISDNSEVLNIAESECIGHTLKNGKQGTIMLQLDSAGNVASINKSKEKKALIVSGQ